MIVALISTYLEGRQAQHAVRTALQACDRVMVVEGQAGPALPDAGRVPPTDLGPYDPATIGTVRENSWAANVRYHAGRWGSDAEKRTSMLEHIRHLEPPVWVLWLDGDEVLVNGEYLRDWIDYIGWQDETDATPTMRIPLRLVELDGSISMSYVKLIRGDLVKTYDLSIANLTNIHDVEEQAGNLHEHISGWLKAHEKAGQGYLYWPPGPAPLDPFIVHRSQLRHPLRAGLRLHDQEAELIAKRAAQ